jgi:hypothetical protein
MLIKKSVQISARRSARISIPFWDGTRIGRMQAARINTDKKISENRRSQIGENQRSILR